ncbi:hypothetical protein IC006_0895 [Sulfuracidifex tepidarius]|uniref:Uncharacterized protein n=1 Tax=Sulfuracidifex tepidarius TaxID=1294262 RepID=A0A510DTW9_9CREN|nr:hypothetical protein IC006_0895 [Sulfuracidifex tepidarius]
MRKLVPPPEMLYSAYDAEQTIRIAEEVLEYAKRLYEEKKNQ